MWRICSAGLFGRYTLLLRKLWLWMLCLLSPHWFFAWLTNHEDCNGIVIQLGVLRPEDCRCRCSYSWSSFTTDSRPVCPGVGCPSGTYDEFFVLLVIFFRQWVCNVVAPSLTRGQVCKLLYNCFWALPEQSLLGRCPAELSTIFYYRDSTNLEGQVPVFRSHVSAVRNDTTVI
jgi:hypothetical protein